MNSFKKSSLPHEQILLFNPSECQPQPRHYERAFVEYARSNERSDYTKQYKVICPAKKLRLKQTFSFSIAIEIRSRSYGWDWKLLPDGRPRCWRQLRDLLIDLTGDSSAWEVCPC